MSISKLELPDGAVPGAPSADPSSFAAAQLPSLESLTRMANELFGSLQHGGYAAPDVAPAAAPTPEIPVALPDQVSHHPLPTGQPLTRHTDAVNVMSADNDRLNVLLSPRYAPQPNTGGGVSLGSTPGFYFLESPTPTPGTTPTNDKGKLAFNPDLIAAPIAGHPTFDVQAIRRDFPILSETVNGQPLIWFDNAATTQKPQAVIERLTYFYEHENSNIHRAAHELAARASDAYEKARDTVARFIRASSSREIVFVRGGTEAINLVAQSWGRQNIGAGDEIVITWLEHHANIVPWQQLAAEKGAVLRVAPVDDRGQVILEEYQRLLNSKTRLVSFTQVSNALGTVTPAKEMAAMARRYGARVLVDAAQSVAHSRTDVQTLDCDWLVFSGHKMFGPTGIGVLYGREDLLNATLPWQGGGNMIQDVTFEKTVYQAAPMRFEAGTGNIADAVGLATAIEYIERIGVESIARYEHELLVYATDVLNRVPGLRLIGTAAEKAGVLSFVVDGLKSEDIGKALNESGIAVRSGHHCAQPILRRFGLETTVRPSLAMYNTYSEVDALGAAMQRIVASLPRAAQSTTAK